MADRSAAAVEMAAQPLWELALHHVAVITVIAIIAITDIAPAAGLWWQSDVLAESPSQQDAQSSPPLDSAESNATGRNATDTIAISSNATDNGAISINMTGHARNLNQASPAPPPPLPLGENGVQVSLRFPSAVTGDHLSPKSCGRIST